MNRVLTVLIFVAPVACAAVPAEPAAMVYLQDASVSSTHGAHDGYVQLTLDEGKGQLLLVLHDDQITALLDGKVLPGDQVVREDDKVTIRDESGETLYEVRVVPGTSSIIYPYDSPFAAVSGQGYSMSGTWPRAFTLGENRKLIGVTTSSVNAALRAQLGLEEGAFVIETVSDGMPAQLGGMEPYDIVTEVEGEPASTERLRETLADKEVGDPLVLTVLRKGQSLDLTLTVQEPRDTGVTTWNSGGGMFDGQRFWNDSQDGKVLQELMAARAGLDAERERMNEELEKLHAEIEQVRRQDTAAATHRLQQLLAEQAELSERQATMDADAAARAEQLALYQAGDATRWLMLPRGQASAFTDDRMAQVEERLARLEELLERLAARAPAPEPSPPAPEKP